MSCQVKCTWSSLIVNNCIIFLNPDNVLLSPVSEGGQLQTTVRSKNGCMQSWQGTETTILLAAFESKHRKWSYIFTEDISNDRLALHSRPPNPHWLDQLGVGDDQVLPVDEEDWDFLFAQQIGCSDWPNENLGGAWNSSLENIYNFSYRENVTADSIIAIEIIWKRRRSRKLKKLLVSLLLSSTFVIFIYATTLRLKNKIALPPHTPVWDCLNRSPPSGRALQSISLSSSPLRALPLKNQKERSHREDLKI